MSDKKAYNGKNLINGSCFVHFILHVKIPDIEKLCIRIEEIIAENPEFCTQENFCEMSSAITALALYEMFRNKGFSKQQAYYKVADAAWEYCTDLSYKVYKKTKSRKTFERLTASLPGKLEEISDLRKIEISEAQKSRIILKCTGCIYEAFFRKYYLRDIAAMFCYGENIVFGSMKTVDFTISDTLILNNRPCIFKLCPYDL